MQRDARDGPDAYELGRVLGNEVVEGAPDRGEIGLDSADPQLAYASASAALRSTSASSVRSQLKVGSDRPK